MGPLDEAQQAQLTLDAMVEGISDAIQLVVDAIASVVNAVLVLLGIA